MLRALLVLLAVANLLAFAWSRGWLGSDGEVGQREPQRLQQQSQPERLTLLSPQAATDLQQRSCLELGPWTGETQLREALSGLERLGLSSADWQLGSVDLPGVWAVATAPIADRAALQRKEEVYKRNKLDYSLLAGQSGDAAAASLLLSRHASEAAAKAALEQLGRRGFRDLRVLQLQAPQQRFSLQLPRADGLLKRQISESRNKALLGSAGLRACAAAAPDAAAASR